jgi:DNA-binding NarL/FixJ family response regulator
MVRILVAEDHTLFRDGIRALLSSTDDLRMVGEANDGLEALMQFRFLRPDLVLLDADFQEPNSAQVVRDLLKQDARVGVVMTSMKEDEYSIFTALRAGARGCLLKSHKPADMFTVFREVSKGGAAFDRSIAERILQYFRHLERDCVPVTGSTAMHLTERECAVLDAIASGSTPSQAANQLGVETVTVRSDMAKILDKLKET